MITVAIVNAEIRKAQKRLDALRYEDAVMESQTLVGRIRALHDLLEITGNRKATRNYKLVA